MHLVSLKSLFAALSGFSLLGTPVAFASDQVLELERAEMSSSCTDIEFLDGYLSEVDANGDELPDYLVNTQRLMCDGSQMMWCGTAGCVHRIWVQGPGGSFEKALETYAYEIIFDRPGDTSYKVATRNGTTRGRLDGQAESAADGSAAAVPVTDGRWSFHTDPVPVAAVGGWDDSMLSFTCEAGALRMRYAGWWLFDGDRIHASTREWDQSDYGIVPTFIVGAYEIDIPVSISEEERMLVAEDTLPLNSHLIGALARGRNVTLAHGGSLEHELGFTLKGSSAALDALRDACN
ncbi:hypothetical protein [Hoeflea sp.]|uniref:hypothetical protein n=1 Tax=Hoeflea sp. TaxID=1940281 RepID=UPI003BB1C938